ncbi:MAG: penicillin-binding protein [Streptococcaceae bacterium]|nr:penicillin-binding protein [Streptococcaceae bacterium]
MRFAIIISTGKVQNVDLKKQANDRYYGTVVTHAKRGTIYDRYGEAIADDATSYSVIAITSSSYKGIDPKTKKEVKLYVEGENYNKIADILNQRLGIDKTTVLDTLESGKEKKLYQVEFGEKGRNISLTTKEEIIKDLDNAGIKGIEFVDHPARLYPNGQFASHFIGVSQLKDEDNEQSGLVGSFGLEAAYNSILSGTDGISIYQKTPAGNPVANTFKQKVKVKDGEDIYTTLDSSLQNYLETLMDQVQEEMNSKWLTATLMTADTGEILATSQRPTFNPDTGDYPDDPNFQWRNLLTEGDYEPGSTIKVFTTAAAQNEGKFNPNATYTAGTIKVADTEINDWDTLKGLRTLTFQQALSNSSNVGMVTLEQMMGDTTWHNYLQRFGFGQTPNSGLLNEYAGALPSDNVVDTAMSAYGQAISVSPLQMLRAFTAVSNNGKMLEPHYVAKVVNNDNKTEKINEPEVVAQPITADTAAKTREYLIQVGTDPDWGTAYSHTKMAPIYEAGGATIAVKTGSAQIAGEGGYLDMLEASNLLYSVVIMAPSDNPKYVMYVTMKQPEHYTGLVMSEITNPLLARAMAQDVTSISASADYSMAQVEVADYVDEDINTAASDARREVLHPVIIGNGSKVLAQSIQAKAKVDPNSRLLLLSSGDMTMPDVTDWTKKDLQAFEKLTGVNVKIEGSGKAVSQSIVYGKAINKGDKLSVSLS